MTRIALVSLVSHVYAGRRLKAGAEFEARGESDARLLIALKRADFAPAVFQSEAELSSAAPKAKSADVPRLAVELSATQVEAIVARSQQLLAETTALSPVEQLPTDYAPEIEQQPEPSADAPADAPADVPADAPTQEEAPSADAEISPRTGKAKRPYKRRDMVAED